MFSLISRYLLTGLKILLFVYCFRDGCFYGQARFRHGVRLLILGKGGHFNCFYDLFGLLEILTHVRGIPIINADE